jgi:hypothetical protein
LGGAPPARLQPFAVLAVRQLRLIERLLKDHGIEHDILSLIDFIKGGIKGREYSKFVFTRSQSDALSLIKQIGEENGLSIEDCSFLSIANIFAPCTLRAATSRRGSSQCRRGKAPSLPDTSARASTFDLLARRSVRVPSAIDISELFYQEKHNGARQHHR